MSKQAIAALAVVAIFMSFLAGAAAQDDKKTKESEFTGDPALDITSGLIQLFPQSAYFHFLNGAAQYKAGYYRKAVNMFEKGLNLDPKSLRGLRGLANVHFQNGNLERAKEQYQRLLAVYPNDYQAHAAIGVIAMLKEDYATAETSLLKSLELNGTYKYALLQLGKLYSLKGDNAQKAIANLRRAYAGFAEDPDLNYELGLLYYERKQYTESTFFFNRAVKLGKTDEKYTTALAKSLYYSGNGEEAVKELRKILRKNNKNAAAHYYMGAALMAQKKYTRAIPEFQRAERLDENYYEARYYMALCQKELGMNPEAVSNLLEFRIHCLLAKKTDSESFTGSLNSILEIEKVLQVERRPNQVPGTRAGMATIPATTVSIVTGQAGAGSETQPQYTTVPVGQFAIDTAEVSNADYKVFLDVTGRNVPTAPKQQLAGQPAWIAATRMYPEGREEYPVTLVSWEDALAYAAWVGKRLPTEKEWVAAASAGQGTVDYPWGNNRPNDRQARYSSSEGPRQVKEGEPNRYGVLNIVGNVAEWCFNAFDDIAGTAPYSGKVLDRAYRGGHWQSGADDIKIGVRNSFQQKTRSAFVGFRCAADIVETEEKK